MSDTAAFLLRALSVLLIGASAVMVGLRFRAGNAPREGRRERYGWVWVAAAAVASRAVLLLAGLLVDAGSLEEAWVRWDAGHYRTIMNQGYTADQSTDAWLLIVFFPLYPALCRLLGGSFVSMLAVSWGCFAGAAVLIDRMAPRGGRLFAQLLLHLFPVTVFLGAPYTESLFLLTTGLTLWAVRKRKWLWAGLMGMLAALTRNLGVLTAVAFIVEYLIMHRERVAAGQTRWRSLVPAILRGGGLWCALIPLGTVIYLGINLAVYGDPLIFLDIQKQHWSQSFGFFGNTLVTSMDYAIHYSEPLYRYFLFIPQTVMMIISMAVMPLLVRKMSPSEGAYSLAYLVCCLSPTWLLSFPRYLMGMVTLYPALARVVTNRWARAGILAVFALVMIPMTLGYLRHWPVL